MSTKNTLKLSLENSRTVRGYEIRRLPLGAFLEAVATLREAPIQILSAMYPGMEPMEALKSMTSLNAEAFRGALMSAVAYAPTSCMSVIAKLLDIPVERLLDDPMIGLDGLAEMLDAWLDLNNIENFLSAVRPLAARIRTAQDAFRRLKTGSNA